MPEMRNQQLDDEIDGPDDVLLTEWEYNRILHGLECGPDCPANCDFASAEREICECGRWADQCIASDGADTHGDL